MNDRYKELFNQATQRLDLVTIGVLSVLLLLTGYLYQVERTYTVPPVDPPQRRQFTVKLPDPTNPDREAANKEEYDFVLSVFHHPTIEIDQDDRGARLLRNNMFELKTAEQQEQLREQLNTLLREAQGHFQQNRYDEALALVDEILRQDRNHRGAADLRRQIQARRN
ncbi:MAG: hypothetical protein JJU11_10045 [Candidatus Sumerlaeia bacterium]|nr:hypothetical protein [Candidatus Sumerlaeia bacterium]